MQYVGANFGSMRGTEFIYYDIYMTWSLARFSLLVEFNTLDYFQIDDL